MLWFKFTLGTICATSRKYPYLPYGGILSKIPHPSRNSNEASYISINVLVLQNPPTPRKFRSLLWGKDEYFLELRNSVFSLVLGYVNFLYYETYENTKLHYKRNIEPQQVINFYKSNRHKRVPLLKLLLFW